MDTNEYFKRRYREIALEFEKLLRDLFGCIADACVQERHLHTERWLHIFCLKKSNVAHTVTYTYKTVRGLTDIPIPIDIRDAFSQLCSSEIGWRSRSYANQNRCMRSQQTNNKTRTHNNPNPRTHPPLQTSTHPPAATSTARRGNLSFLHDAFRQHSDRSCLLWL